MKKSQISRRKFLAGLGVAAALPMVNAIPGSRHASVRIARAKPATPHNSQPIPRMMVMRRNWKPEHGGSPITVLKHF